VVSQYVSRERPSRLFDELCAKGRQWIVYTDWSGSNGYHDDDLDMLQARSFALNDYPCTLDELNEVSAPPEDQDTSGWGAL
jgi:hypothetical protein